MRRHVRSTLLWSGVALVLTSSMVLGLARVSRLQLVHRTTVVLASFAPHACFAWFIATALFLAAGRGWQRALAVVSAAGLVANLTLLVPYVPHQMPPAASTFSVATLNLRCLPVNTERLAAVVRSLQPDVVLLQDTTQEAWTALQASGWARDYPIAAAQPTITTAPSPTGQCDSWLSARVPLTLSTARPAGSNQVAYRIDLPSGAVSVLPVAVTNPTVDVRHWAQDLAEVRVTAMAQPGPLVVLGDFNAVREHAPMEQLRAAGLTDAAEQAKAGWVPTFPARGWLPPLLAIDHVMVNASLQATSLASFEVPGCDHRGLLARLRLTGVG